MGDFWLNVKLLYTRTPLGAGARVRKVMSTLLWYEKVWLFRYFLLLLCCTLNLEIWEITFLLYFSKVIGKNYLLISTLPKK